MSIETYNHVFASSFADPRDIRAFKLCKAAGGTDQQCFRVGDNGIGCWDDDVSEGSGPSCALPPETIIDKWGSVDEGKYHQIHVIRNENLQVTCLLKDRMPHIRNLANAARIDLNPDAVRALGWEPPLMEKVAWAWVDDDIEV